VGIQPPHAMHLLTLAGNARNYTAQGEESLAAWSAKRSDWRRRLARRETSRRTWASRVGKPGSALSPRRKR